MKSGRLGSNQQTKKVDSPEAVRAIGTGLVRTLLVMDLRVRYPYRGYRTKLHIH
jgi:hypothetical protein